MKRREFLGSCAACVAGIPLAPLFGKKHNPIPAKKPPLPADLPDSIPTNRIQRYRRYEKMMEECPELNVLMTQICDAAVAPHNPLQEGERHRVERMDGSDWTYAFHDHFISDLPSQFEQFPFVIAQQFKNEGMLDNYTELRAFCKEVGINSRSLWDWARELAVHGDLFLEKVSLWDRHFHGGILKLEDLPCNTMFRIETTKQDLVEFQQSREGPDYDALVRQPIRSLTACKCPTDDSLTLRFRPEWISHMRMPDLERRRVGPIMPARGETTQYMGGRPGFYPYGVSLIEYWKSGNGGKFGMFDLERDAGWLVNAVRNTLLDGLQKIAEHHMKLRGRECQFYFI